MKLTLAFAAAGIIAISAATLGPTAQAQEATPTRMQCNSPSLPGGQTIAILDHATVTPPEGFYYNWSILPPAGGPATFTVCMVGTDARVFIGVDDCTELRRTNPSGEATLDARLDAIVESCELGRSASALPNFCHGPFRQGGQQIELANGIWLTPPGGGSYTIGAQPPNTSSIAVCYAEGDAYVVIAYRDCSEVRRENPTQSASADYYLDRVVESCVKVVQPAIPPERLIPIEAPNEAPQTRITPPDTGDAGLRTDN